MSVHAFLTALGPAPLKADLFESRAAWLDAREQETALLRAIEGGLSARRGAPVRLSDTVLDGSLAPGGDAADLMLGESVGGSDGLAPLQGFAVQMAHEGRPPDEWRFDDPRAPMWRAREAGFAGALADFRHLVDHDPLGGYYVPLEFVEPLRIPGAVRGEADEISVGSAQRLAEELDRWSAVARDFAVPDWLLGHHANLMLVTRASLRTGLAIAIL
jgi:hypothetical protein